MFFSMTSSGDQKTGAAWLLEGLERQGVEFIFGYPGGAIMPVYDALIDSKLTHILVRHEQAAALAADGYARASGQVGVCMATSGPGATNLLTGIANAYMDSVPMIAITGQVATSLMGTDAFQEIDIFGAVMPMVKHSYIIRDAAEIGNIIDEAFMIAKSGRPGPVLIDLPKDIAAGLTHLVDKQTSPVCVVSSVDQSAIAIAIEILKKAKKPVIYAGGGVVIAEAVEPLRKFVKTTQIPLAATLKGLGILAQNHPLFLGMLGMHGNEAANLAIDQADVLLVLGARFDDRATGKISTFARNAKIIHLDVDDAEIDKLRRADVALLGDMGSSLSIIGDQVSVNKEWRQQCQSSIRRYEPRYDAPTQNIYAPRLLRNLSIAGGDDLIISCDVGQHQMWVAQHCHFSQPQAHLSSGGLGTMGYGIPAGIGASVACPDKTVVTVTGDGSVMMNIQELATINRYALPLKILLLDNSRLGMVRQWQELFFDERFSETDLSDNPDFCKVSEAFGIESFRISKDSEIDDAIDRIITSKSAIFVHVVIDPADNVWPLVPPGHSNANMMKKVNS